MMPEKRDSKEENVQATRESQMSMTRSERLQQAREEASRMRKLQTKARRETVLQIRKRTEKERFKTGLFLRREAEMDEEVRKMLFNSLDNTSDDTEMYEGNNIKEWDKQRDPTEAEIQMAGNLTMLYEREDIANNNEIRRRPRPVHGKELVQSRADLNKLLAKEKLDIVKDDTGRKKWKYHHVWLVTSDKILWVEPSDPAEEKECTWHTMALNFYFPNQNIIRTVRLKSSWGAFAKP